MIYLGKKECTVLKKVFHLLFIAFFFPLDNVANQKVTHIFHTGGTGFTQ